MAAGEEDDDARAVLDEVAELVENLAGDLLRRDPFFQPLVLVEGQENLFVDAARQGLDLIQKLVEPGEGVLLELFQRGLAATVEQNLLSICGYVSA